MKISVTNPGEDLQAIRNMMERSSRFLSLSGLSGIFAGCCALLGAGVAWFLFLDSGQINLAESTHGQVYWQFAYTPFFLALDALMVLIFAALGAVYFSYRKAIKTGHKIWTISTRQMVIHLIIPLLTGGIFSVVLAFHNNVGFVPAVMLIFYGLALVNAGKFTFGEIHYLGLTEVVLGILAAVFLQYGLLLWAIGFGLMHIVYGTYMYFRYER